MGRLVISGIGPLSPLGTGREAYWEAVLRGASCIQEVSGFSSLRDTKGSRIAGQEIEKYVDDRRFRRAADISKYAIAAVRLAMGDAGIGSLRGEETGLIVAVTHGAMQYTEEYHRALVTGGAEDVSPILFSDSVLNAPAGNVALCFGIQGAAHTVVGSVSAFIKGIMLAERLMDAGLLKRVIVVSAEELNELSFFCRTAFEGTPLSEGAGALLIEREDPSSTGEPYCRIAGHGAFFDPLHMEHAFEKAVEGALAMGGITMDDVKFAFIDAPPDLCDGRLGSVPSGSITQFTGNAFCVSAAWNVILASLAIRHGIVPDAFWEDRRPRDSARTLLVCNLEETGAASAVVLSSPD